MKNKLQILIIGVILFASCEKQEPVYRLTYDFEPDQETIIEIDVVPVGDVVLEKEDMLMEVNADYYNRYGIGIELNFLDRIQLSDEGKFRGVENRVTVYVVEQSLIQLRRASSGYTIRYTGTINKSVIVIGESSQRNAVLAHEIGHAYGLHHVELENNLMEKWVSASQYNVPHDLVGSQVDSILTETKGNHKLSLETKHAVEIFID